MNKNTEAKKITKYTCPRCANSLQLYANYYFTIRADIDPDTGKISEPNIGNIYKMKIFQGQFQCTQCGVLDEDHGDTIGEATLNIYTNIADNVGTKCLSNVFPSGEQFQVVKKSKGYRFYKDQQFKNLEFELEKLKSRIRDSSSIEDLRCLVRYVGPTEEEELQAEKRIKRIDKIYEKYGDELPPNAQSELDILTEKQDKYEYKYC